MLWTDVKKDLDEAAEQKVVEAETNALVGLDAYQDFVEATESTVEKHESPYGLGKCPYF